MTRLFVRFVAALLLVVTGAFAAFVWWVHVADERYYKNNFFQQVTEFAAQVAKERSSDAPDDTAEDYPATQLPPAALSDWLELDRSSAAVVLKLPNSDDYLGFVSDPEAAARIESTGLKYLGVAAIWTMIVILVASWYLAYAFYRKLRRQESVIRRIADGDLSARGNAHSKDALGQLGVKIDSMADRIETLVQSHKELLREVSHELRTPLSRMRFCIEMMRGDACPQSSNLRLEQLDTDLVQMNQLIDELLTLQRLDAQTVPLKTEPVPIEDFVLFVVDAFENTFRAQRQCRAHVIDQRDLRALAEIPANLQLVQRAVENLTINAIRHADKAVRMVILNRTNFLILRIMDDGGGIPDVDRDRIFEPFQAASNGEVSGAGLGLPIARRIAEGASWDPFAA